MRWAAVFHCPPQLAQRSFERRLEWQLHRWAGYRALGAHLEWAPDLAASISLDLGVIVALASDIDLELTARGALAPRAPTTPASLRALVIASLD